MSIDLELRRGILADLVVQNPGPLPAHDVTFEFEGEPPWRLSGKPPLFSKGLAFLPPGRRFPFFIGSMVAMVGRDGVSAVRFTIHASYLHPSVDARLTETFRFDLNDYFGSSVVESDAMESAKLVADELKKIHDDLSKAVAHLESLTSISGATGLDLSVTAIRNLAANFAGGPAPPKMNPAFQKAPVFMEILGVDWKTGLLLEDLFRHRPTDDIEPPLAIPRDILDRLPEFFDMSAWKRDSEAR